MSENSEEKKRIAIFTGNARIGEVLGELSSIQLRPEDFSSPVALQMAISRIYNALLKSLEKGFKKKYVAEVKFTDALGNTVVFAVDLGEEPPPFSSNNVKARILVEIYEGED